MSPSRHELRLHEEVLLIALRDDTGTPESKAGWVDYALGGALLIELALEGRVSIAADQKAKVELLDDGRFEDEVLDECVAALRDSKRTRPAAEWVGKFACLSRLRARVAGSLCRLGILLDSEAKVLLVFKRKAFPTIDPEPERRLLERLRRAIESEDAVEPRTAALLALADGTGLLGVHFDKTLLKHRKRRLAQISEGEVVAGAAREAVNAVQAATQAAILVTTVAATSVSTR